MLVPVRCFNCAKALSKPHKIYTEELKKNKKSSKEILDSLNLKRYCCRSTVMTAVDSSNVLAFRI